MALIQHYNHEKYWRRRAIVIDPTNKTPLVIKLYYLYYIKRTLVIIAHLAQICMLVHILKHLLNYHMVPLASLLVTTLILAHIYAYINKLQ